MPAAPAVPAASKNLEPLSVKLLQAAGVLSALLVLVVLNSLLNTSGGESPFNPNPVAAAAQRTQDAPGMRIALSLQSTNGASGSVAITGHGTYNGDTNLAEVTYAATTPKGQLDFDAILGESAWYFRYPQFGATLPEGKEWVKLEGLKGQSEKGTMGVESPDELLESVASGGTIKPAGQAKVRGKQTTRYHLVFSLDELLAVLRDEGKTETAEQLEDASVQLNGPVQAEAFIDKQGVLRRARTLSSITVGGQTVTTRVSMDFFAFGIEPDIKVPDDSRAYDMTPMLEEKLGQLS